MPQEEIQLTSSVSAFLLLTEAVQHYVFKFPEFALSAFAWILGYTVPCTAHHIDSVSSYFCSQAKSWLQYLSSISQKLDVPFYSWAWMNPTSGAARHIFGHSQIKSFSSVLKWCGLLFSSGLATTVGDRIIFFDDFLVGNSQSVRRKTTETSQWKYDYVHL